MKRKSKDYYRQIAEQEKRTAELNEKIDREIGSEDRKKYNIERTLKLRECE